MEPLTKNQHYIPRAAYLRKFSNTHFNDDRKNKLLAYDKEKDVVFISNVQKLANERFLYESEYLEPNLLENHFAEVEERIQGLLDAIVDVCENVKDKNIRFEIDDNVSEDIKFFTMFQLFRTPARLEESIKLANGNIEEGKESFLFQLYGKDEKGNVGPQHYVEEFCRDTIISIGYNYTDIPFFLSDDPVYCEGNDDYPLLFRFAITPQIQILIINKDHPEYKQCAEEKEYLRYIENSKDVQLWNRASLKNSKRFIYCTPTYGKDKFEKDTCAPLRNNMPI